MKAVFPSDNLIKNEMTVPIFDIDGVLTNPDTKVPNPELLAFISQKLRQGVPVALATGRAWEWVQRVVLTPMRELLQGDDGLDLLFVSCEKGAIAVTFENGKARKTSVAGVSLPSGIIQKLKFLVPENSGVFIDIEKERMFSIEIECGVNTEEVQRQKELLSQLKLVIEEALKEHEDLAVEVTEIALDVQRKGINKRIASQEFIKFLESKHTQGQSQSPYDYFFTVFGDSPSDLLLSEELYEKGYTTCFGYVGGRPLAKTYPFQVENPPVGILFDKGTLFLLKDSKPAS